MDIQNMLLKDEPPPGQNELLEKSQVEILVALVLIRWLD